MIFFDIDDTLLDHSKSEYLAAKAFYNRYRYEIHISVDKFYMLWNQVSEKYFDKYLKGDITFAEQRVERIKEIYTFLGINLSSNDAEIKFRYYLNKYEENWIAFEDVTPCLNELCGHILGIISNGDLQQQTLKLKRMGIINLFSNIITADELGVAKPNVKIFEKACLLVNERPQNCYYIGDNLNTDILPCKEIGIKAIWLNRRNESSYLSDTTTINSLHHLKYVL